MQQPPAKYITYKYNCNSIDPLLNITYITVRRLVLFL
jgi:hypothetical protein